MIVLYGLRVGVAYSPAEGVAEGVRQQRESQLHCKPEGGGKVRFLRRGRGRALMSGLVDDLVVVDVHLGGVAVKTLRHEDLDLACSNACGEGRTQAGSAGPSLDTGDAAQNRGGATVLEKCADVDERHHDPLTFFDLFAVCYGL